MTAPPLTTSEDQGASFVELFFDLVFVFGITQTVELLHHDLTLEGVLHAVLVFWLVWWAWTQFTWALNSANAKHPLVELGTLGGTAVAFLMSVAIPGSFSGRALWFAIPYVLVRILGLWMYGLVARSRAGQRAAVRLFATASVSGLAAVVVGASVGLALQPWFWALAIFLDVVAAAVGGQAEDWNIKPGHFAERHGLIVIIALGESLIVAAAGLAEATFTGPIVAVSLLGVLVACSLWWSYFPVAKPTLEHALASEPASRQGAMARDVFSLAHFPMLCGVVAYAVALEEAIAHPSDPLPPGGRLALALGPALFVAGTALAMWRATCGRPLPRVLLAGTGGAIVFLFPGAPASVALGVVLVAIVLVAALDEWGADRLGRRVHDSG